MQILNSLLGYLFDGLLYPFRSMPPIVGLTAISVVTGVAMLLVFKVTSDQERIAAVKRQIHAGIFEIRLFNDDFRAILRAQMEILRHNLTYLRLSLVPVLWMIVPLLLMVVQLQFHYGYSGLEPGQTAILKVRLRGGADEVGNSGGRGSGALGSATPSISLGVPSGLRIDSELLWIPSLAEANWRVVAARRGSYELNVRVGEQVFTKSLVASGAVVRRSPVRPASGFLEQLLYPAEPPLAADAPVESISLSYPERQVTLLGWHTHWMIVFFILTVVFAFALRKALGVNL